ncbi:single-stranded DNA-binding protein [Turicibacter bilis]
MNHLGKENSFSFQRTIHALNEGLKLIIRGENNMIDVNELLEEAIRETENLNEDEVFLVKDLFKGYVWNRIPRKDRLLLGTLFLNYVNMMEGSIKAIEKTSSNQQRYKKIKS